MCVPILTWKVVIAKYYLNVRYRFIYLCNATIQITDLNIISEYPMHIGKEIIVGKQ